LPDELTRVTHSDEETAREGELLAAGLEPGDVVLLTGPLGAGKTVFVRGLARGLGVDPGRVHSPTFAMVAQYGRLVHVDLYRIDDEREVEELGLAELARRNVLAVEWGEKLPGSLRRGAVEVAFEDLGEDDRRLTIRKAQSSR